MKKAILIEIAWLVGLYVVTYLVCNWIVSNEALDIRAHDTYFVGKHQSLRRNQLVFASFFAIGFIANLIRAGFLRFKMSRVNIILIVFNCLFLFTIDKLLVNIWYFTMATFKPENNNGDAEKGLFYGIDPSIFHILNIVPWIRILLSLTLGFNCFMLGKFYRDTKQLSSNP